MTRVARALLGVAVAGLALVGAHAAGAQTAGERIRAYDVNIAIQPDGMLRISESITYDFGSEPHHGILRDLVQYEQFNTTQVRRYDVHVEQVSADAGTSSAVKQSSEGPYLHLRIGSPDHTITGVHHYRIVYTVRGAPLTFPDHDELYWDAIGNQWPVAILNARVTVVAPAPITRTTCFAGPQGSALPCSSAAARGRRAVFGQRVLGAFSGVTTVVAMPKGTIQPPPHAILTERPVPPNPITRVTETAAKSFAITGLTVGLAAGLLVVGLAAVVLLATRRGRDRRYTGSAVDAAMGNQSGEEEPLPVFGRIDGPVEFVPPDGIRPGQVGTLVDEQANLLDVTASIVDLAVRGWLTISEAEGTGLFHHHPDYQLTRLTGGKGTLLPYEDVLLQSLFKDGSEVRLSGLKYQFRASLEEIQNSLYDDSVKQGWYRVRPDRTRRVWTHLATVVLIVGVGLTWWIAKTTSFGLVPLALIVTGIALHATAGRMPARTGKGTAMLSRVRGFRRLFDEGEEDVRAHFAEQHDIFSQYLPYAIVFGCTKKWAKAFEGLDAEQLQTNWFVGNHPFDALVLAHAVDSFGTTATGTMYASMPSSSGSSGFSGGGFSGGGGGGGGGGSW